MKIYSRIRDYLVHFSDSADFLPGFERLSKRCYVIDDNVWQLYRNGLLSGLPEAEVIVFPVNEERKSITTVEELYDLLIGRSIKRNMTLISIGGGILQDITGFTASTLYRGINWIFVPTTLLAQADSCIGSKTSLNYKGFKNLIGTFYPPSEVFVHIPFLNTLKKVDFFSGLGEVVKLFIMGGKEKAGELIGLLPGILRKDQGALQNAVLGSLAVKYSYMAEDEFDTGRRNLLNFGHTLGHALESASKYDVSHGQAVIIGIIFANIAARNRGLLSAETFTFLLDNLLFPALCSVPAPAHLDAEIIYEAMKKDKKRVGDDMVLVILKNDYTLSKVIDFKMDELARALGELIELMSVRHALRGHE